MSYQNISVQEFKEKMKEDDVMVIDVRDPEELREGEIHGHDMISLSDPSFAIRIGELDRDKTYLLYCRAGGRSANACEYMAGLGFKHLYNLEGGIKAWNAAGERH